MLIFTPMIKYGFIVLGLVFAPQDIIAPGVSGYLAASVSATVLFVSILGPQAGPWALILAASIAGALWPLSGTRTHSIWQALMLLLRCALLAIFVTGVLARYLEESYGLAVSDGLALVALAIGALGNGWRAFFAGFEALMGGAADAILRRGRSNGSEQ